MKRREWKADARKVLKKHYWFFVVLCLVVAILGIECTSSLSGTQLSVQDTAENVAGKANVKFNDIAGMAMQIVTDAVSKAVKTDQSEEETAVSEMSGRSADLENAGQSEQPEAYSAVFGRTRGVFAMLVNGFTSGSYIASLIVGIRSITGSDETAVNLFIMVVLAAMFFFSYFFLNVCQSVIRRMFLEARCYDKVPAQRAFFLLKIRKWMKAAVTLLLQVVYQLLWSVTIIGGIIKYYSYIMVPYIVAENPDIGAKETITLSRRLMKGHKWECFVLSLSFWGWDFLGILTMGVTNLFFANPYRMAVMGEYYAYIRRRGKEKGIKNADLLSDHYLFEKPKEAVLEAAYTDVMEAEAVQVAVVEELYGVRKWIADFFGLVVWNGRKEKEYENEAARAVRLAYDKGALDGKCYPTRLYPIPEKAKRQWIGGLHYIRHYSVWSMIMIFFAMSLVGWLWEGSLHLITDGEFVNRGVLHGPWLPIYGSGSVLILLLLNKLRKKPALEFLTIIILCGCIEYLISWYLEQIYNGMKWWDYTGYFLNLNGRICAEGLLTFGVGGMAIVYLLAPLLDNLIRRIPKKILVSVCLILLVVFCADQLYSKKHPNTGEGITDDQSKAVEYVIPGRI